MTAPGRIAMIAGRPGRADARAVLDAFEAAGRLTASAAHAAWARRAVGRFLWAQRICGPGEISRAAVVEFLAALRARGLTAKTIMNYRSAIATFAAFCRDRGLLAADPCAGIRLARPEGRLPRYLGADEIAAVLSAADRLGCWPEVCLALATGLRRGELIRLRWADVDVERRTLAVRKAKGRRPRVVPLAGAAVAAIEEQRRKAGRLAWVFPARRTWRGGWRYEDRPRAANWWTRAMRTIRREVPTFPAGRGWHLLRHTFASRAVQAGVSLYKLAQWMGHTDVRTTQIYAHLRPGFDEDIEAAAPVRAAAADRGRRS